MDAVHGVLPNDDGILFVFFRNGCQRDIVVIAIPDNPCVVARIAGEPFVAVVIRRAGLAGSRHIGQAIASCRAAFLQDTFEDIGDDEGRFRLIDLGILRHILKQDVAVRINHSFVGIRLRIETLVGEGRVGAGHLQRGHAAAEAAQRDADIVLRAPVDADHAQIKQRCLTGQDVQPDLRRNRIAGNHQCFANRQIAFIGRL